MAEVPALPLHAPVTVIFVRVDSVPNAPKRPPQSFACRSVHTACRAQRASVGMSTSRLEATAVRIGQYRLSKTLGIGSFGKVKRERSRLRVPPALLAADV